MTHANLDPLRYRYHGWKKMLAAPFERWLFSKTDRVVVTGEWEEAWCRQWGLKNEMQIVDLKSFFELDGPLKASPQEPPQGCALRLLRSDFQTDHLRHAASDSTLHVLYLGRRHPLKGVGFLERAVQEINEKGKVKSEKVRMIDLRTESNLFGAEKEKAWEWADVLCLPTLSENFGLVVAESLEHGRPVITTDGAPAWEPPPEAAEGVRGQELGVREGKWWDHLVYLRGYRDGSDAERVKLLRDALVEFVG